MTIIRVVEQDKSLGDFEADQIPAIGDSFTWKTFGHFLVTAREWNFPAEYNDVAHRVTLTVDRLS